MTLGERIAQYRKNLGLTQEALATQLGVTNQAVSKWESDQCCPDVMLLPKLAEIFGISVDALLGREAPQAEPKQEEPPKPQFFHFNLKDFKWTMPSVDWADDNTLRVVLFKGNKLVEHHPVAKEITFKYEGPALNIDSAFAVACGDVTGDVDAGASVSCGNVGGDVDAGSHVSCGNVEGDASAGSRVSCGNVEGDVTAGTDVQCGSVGGDVTAGCNVTCTEVGGDIDSGGGVSIQR